MHASQKKRDYRRTMDSAIRFTSTVGEGTVFKGNFTGGENIVVRGTVHGKSDVQGAVVIAEGGKWYGRLCADIVVVVGYVEGDVCAREKIELLDKGLVKGNMQSPVISIETGGVHEGGIEMKNVQQFERFAEKRES